MGYLCSYSSSTNNSPKRIETSTPTSSIYADLYHFGRQLITATKNKAQTPDFARSKSQKDNKHFSHKSNPRSSKLSSFLPMKLSSFRLSLLPDSNPGTIIHFFLHGCHNLHDSERWRICSKGIGFPLLAILNSSNRIPGFV